MEEAGLRNCVSVPGGAPEKVSNKLSSLAKVKMTPNNFKELILCLGFGSIFVYNNFGSSFYMFYLCMRIFVKLGHCISVSSKLQAVLG